MAHYDLEEQEQLDSLKTWWKMYGNLVTGLLLAVSVALLGWQGWGRYQSSQSAEASAVYAVLEQAVAMNDAQKVKAAAGELAEKFGGTTYASLGALMAAKQSFEAGDLKTAKAQLTWVAEKGKHEIQDMARLRLAAVLLDEKSYDEALKQLEAKHAAAFDARYLDLKGDVLAAQGKKNEARLAYQSAQSKLGGQGGVAAELLQQKLDGLGEGV